MPKEAVAREAPESASSEVSGVVEVVLDLLEELPVAVGELVVTMVVNTLSDRVLVIVDTDAVEDLVAEVEILESATECASANVSLRQRLMEHTNQCSVSLSLAKGGKALLGSLEVVVHTARLEARRHFSGGTDSLVVGNGGLLIYAGEEACLW